jgi:hypothetical protein
LALFFNGYIYLAFSLGALVNLLCAIYCGILMKETKTIPFYKGELFVRESMEKMKHILVTGYLISIRVKTVLYTILLHAAFLTLTLMVIFFWTVAMETKFGVGEMTIYWYLIVFLGFAAAFSGAKFLEHLDAESIRLRQKTLSNDAQWSLLVRVSLGAASAVFILATLNMLGRLNIFVFMACITVVYFCWGILIALYRALINYFIPPEHSKERATIMSYSLMLQSVVEIIILIPALTLKGQFVITYWIIPAGVLLVTTFFLNRAMKRYQRKSEDSIDPNNLVPVKD